jgi:outer membrane protein OmpA-like peptidoglycan-associated protein
MNSKKNDFFWPSYTDLMTSLFFIMLVLFVLVFTKQSRHIKDLERQLAIVNAVDENLKPLKSDKSLFTYEEEYKRFKLSFEVKFYPSKSSIDTSDLEKYSSTINNIDMAGYKLKNIINGLKRTKESDSKLKDVSYILVIAGYASKDNTDETYNYELSYKRALSLRNYWRLKGIDFEAPEYNNLIDLQISGNGLGGVGRLQNETDNQRFLIQIFPKIGDIK